MLFAFVGENAKPYFKNLFIYVFYNTVLFERLLEFCSQSERDSHYYESEECEELQSSRDKSTASIISFEASLWCS